MIPKKSQKVSPENGQVWPRKKKKSWENLKFLYYINTFDYINYVCLQGNPHKILVALCGVVQCQLQLTVAVFEIIVYIFIDTEFYCLFSGFFTWLSLIKILNIYVIVTEFVILG